MGFREKVVEELRDRGMSRLVCERERERQREIDRENEENEREI